MNVRMKQHSALVVATRLLLGLLSGGAVATQNNTDAPALSALCELDAQYQPEDEGGDDPGSCPIVALLPTFPSGGTPVAAIPIRVDSSRFANPRNRSPPATPL